MEEKSCGFVIFAREGGKVQYLLTISRAGEYTFPKGHVEDGETELETALRETREETGVVPRVIEGFVEHDRYTMPSKGGKIKNVVYFLGEANTKNVVIQPEEVNGYRWARFEDAITLLKFTESKRIIASANDFLRKAGEI